MNNITQPCFFFSSRRRHTRSLCDWSSDVCSSDLGGGRRGDQEGTYAKITFDRQIVAIAKVNNVTVIYSDDDGVRKFAERNGLTVVRTWELPLPPEKHPLFRHTLETDATADSAPEEKHDDDTENQRQRRKISLKEEEV